MRKHKKDIAKKLIPSILSISPTQNQKDNMKTTLLNPVEYDAAIMELLRNNKPSESLQLAINLLRDARALAEVKLAKTIAREERKASRQAEAKALRDYREWALNN